MQGTLTICIQSNRLPETNQILQKWMWIYIFNFIFHFGLGSIILTIHCLLCLVYSFYLTSIYDHSIFEVWTLALNLYSIFLCNALFLASYAAAPLCHVTCSGCIGGYTFPCLFLNSWSFLPPFSPFLLLPQLPSSFNHFIPRALPTFYFCCFLSSLFLLLIFFFPLYFQLLIYKFLTHSISNVFCRLLARLYKNLYHSCQLWKIC